MKGTWDRKAVRARVVKLLEEIDQVEENSPNENSGGVVPACVAVMFILDKIKSQDFFGSIKIGVKGIKVLSPEILNQTFKLQEENGYSVLQRSSQK